MPRESRPRRELKILLSINSRSKIKYLNVCSNLDHLLAFLSWNYWSTWEQSQRFLTWQQARWEHVKASTTPVQMTEKKQAVREREGEMWVVKLETFVSWLWASKACEFVDLSRLHLASLLWLGCRDRFVALKEPTIELTMTGHKQSDIDTGEEEWRARIYVAGTFLTQQRTFSLYSPTRVFIVFLINEPSFLYLNIFVSPLLDSLSRLDPSTISQNQNHLSLASFSLSLSLLPVTFNSITRPERHIKHSTKPYRSVASSTKTCLQHLILAAARLSFSLTLHTKTTTSSTGDIFSKFELELFHSCFFFLLLPLFSVRFSFIQFSISLSFRNQNEFSFQSHRRFYFLCRK